MMDFRITLCIDQIDLKFFYDDEKHEPAQKDFCCSVIDSTKQSF
tara:strand:+ start:1810 stop:1941 length:132 start_codon:yes stop_codon:yes gene_type:complete